MEINFGNVVIADDVKICKDIFSRSKGLRFSKKLKEGQAILFVSPEESYLHTSIDMFFVFFSIDVLWLDNEKRIVDVRRGVKPFTPLLRPKKAAKYVLELPVGCSKILKEGDILGFDGKF